MGFPNGVDWWSSQFGQNVQKLPEIRTSTFWVKKLGRGNGGD